MPSDLHEVVEKAREASAENHISSLAGVVYRGSGYSHNASIQRGDLESRLLSGTLKDVFSEYCSMDGDLCVRRTTPGGAEPLNVGMSAAMLLTLAKSNEVKGTWKEEMFVGKPGVTRADVVKAIADNVSPTIVCYLSVKN